MSVLDDLHGMTERVAQRMKELRPLVDEYHELEQAAKLLGLPDAATTPAPSPGASPAPTRRRRRATKAAAGGSRRRARTSKTQSSPGLRRQQVLDAVSGHPGITVREIGNQLGVDPTSLYRAVRALESERLIAKRGSQLHLP
jgi:hypothetical protein